MSVHIPQKGWTAKVPSITVDPDDAETYLRYLQVLDGVSRGQAKQRFAEGCQGVFNNMWLQRVRLRLRRMEKQYKAMHGSLEGFDRELLQGLYVPGWRTPGHLGDPQVKRLMVMLGEDA